MRRLTSLCSILCLVLLSFCYPIGTGTLARGEENVSSQKEVDPEGSFFQNIETTPAEKGSFILSVALMIHAQKSMLKEIQQRGPVLKKQMMSRPLEDAFVQTAQMMQLPEYVFEEKRIAVYDPITKKKLYQLGPVNFQNKKILITSLEKGEKVASRWSTWEEIPAMIFRSEIFGIKEAQAGGLLGLGVNAVVGIFKLIGFILSGIIQCTPAILEFVSKIDLGPLKDGALDILGGMIEGGQSMVGEIPKLFGTIGDSLKDIHISSTVAKPFRSLFSGVSQAASRLGEGGWTDSLGRLKPEIKMPSIPKFSLGPLKDMKIFPKLDRSSLPSMKMPENGGGNDPGWVYFYPFDLFVGHGRKEKEKEKKKFEDLLSILKEKTGEVMDVNLHQAVKILHRQFPHIDEMLKHRGSEFGADAQKGLKEVMGGVNQGWKFCQEVGEYRFLGIPNMDDLLYRAHIYSQDYYQTQNGIRGCKAIANTAVGGVQLVGQMAYGMASGVSTLAGKFRDKVLGKKEEGQGKDTVKLLGTSKEELEEMKRICEEKKISLDSIDSLDSFSRKSSTEEKREGQSDEDDLIDIANSKPLAGGPMGPSIQSLLVIDILGFDKKQGNQSRKIKEEQENIQRRKKLLMEYADQEDCENKNAPHYLGGISTLLTEYGRLDHAKRKARPLCQAYMNWKNCMDSLGKTQLSGNERQKGQVTSQSRSTSLEIGKKGYSFTGSPEGEGFWNTTGF